MRRQFVLPEDDIIYLNSLNLNWETLNDAGMQWVLIHDYPVVDAYNHKTVTVALKIETGYPRAALDMAYFYPPLQRTDEQLINALSLQNIDQKNYQRWSRHRTAQNPWRPGEDDLSTHMSLVTFWFEQEFIKKPTHGITA